QLLRNRQLHSPKKVRRRLEEAIRETGERPGDPDNLLKIRILSDIPTLNQLLAKFRFSKAIADFLIQAGSSWTVGRFIFLSLMLGLGTFVLANLFLQKSLGISLGAAVMGAYLPTFYFRSCKEKREQKFEDQLPEVLDLMGRGLRAGHSVTSAIQFAADESPAPAGPEFKRVFDEVTFGMDLPVALKNLARRVDCPDLRFMITAITIQREVGGNLSDLFDRLADLMRKRVVLIRQTRSLTAQGRISGQILIALPILMAAYLFVANPDYISLLYEDPLGLKIAIGAAVSMFLGHLVIQKIVNIDTL
ncbi:MAG TPA: type II secretion system F family protein, partial [Nitrospiria bacterium]